MRRRVLGLATVMTALGLVAFAGGAAEAHHEVSPPPWAECNLGVSDRTGGATDVTWTVRCQTAGTIDSNFDVRYRAGNDSTDVSFGGTAWSVTTNTGGRFAASKVFAGANHASGVHATAPLAFNTTGVTVAGVVRATGLRYLNAPVLGTPEYPEHFFAGGSAPTSPADGSCEVLDEQSDGTVVRARLRVTVDNPHASDAIAADHGDGEAATAPDSGEAYWYYFDAAHPAGGGVGDPFTVTYTISRDEQDDETCVLELNFYDDALDSSEFGEGTADDDPEEEPDCGWNVICWLKKLFVPTGDQLADSAGSVRTAAEENWPLGPLMQTADDVGVIEGDTTGGGLGGEDGQGGETQQFVVTDQAVGGANDCTTLRLPVDLSAVEFDAPDGELPIDAFSSCPEGVDRPGTQQSILSKFARMSRWATTALALLAGIAVVRNAVEDTIRDGN